MKAQGSELYLIDPADDSLLEVGCVLNFTFAGVQIEQNEVTCLADAVRRYEPGLGTPGAANFGIQTSPTDASHIRLHELFAAQTRDLKFALGWSDGTGIDPSVEAGSPGADADWDLPATRSWLIFEGFMNSFPFEFAQNTSVASNIGIQVSGMPQWIVKTEEPTP